MNEPTTTKKSEFVFRRLADSFDQFSGDVSSAFVGNIYSQALLAIVLLLLAARVVYRYSNPARQPGTKDALANGLKLGFWWLLVAYVICGLSFYYVRDAGGTKGGTDSLATASTGNVAKWYALTLGLFALGSVFVVLMYIKDTRSVRWYFAVPLVSFSRCSARQRQRQLPAGTPGVLKRASEPSASRSWNGTTARRAGLA